MVKKKKYIHRVLFMQPVKQMVTWIFSTSIICAIVIVLDLNGIIKVRIQTSVFIGFASLIAGISGTVGAIMVGFIISKLQAIESDRQLWYIELKHELKEMRDVLHSLVYEYFQCILNYLAEQLSFKKEITPGGNYERRNEGHQAQIISP